MRDDPKADDTGPPAWLETVRRRAGRWAASGIGPAWVVAVSGGGDSVGLLRVLHGLAPGLGLRLSVAHLDHNVRGEASRRDAEFVAALAGSLGLPFDLGSWSPTRTSHFEADARAARLAWLADVAARRGAGAVAVGHTRDDQAETILHRILRGTGPRGLAGIPAVRPLASGVTMVRPLLGASRRQVEAELARLGQSFREDATNRDAKYTRARIRHELIPGLEAGYNPRVVSAIVRLGRLAAAERRMLDGYVASASASIVREAGPERIAFDRRAAAAVGEDLAVEVVRRAWRDAGWPEGSMDARRWRRVASGMLGGGADGDVGEGVSLRIEPDAVVLSRGPRRVVAPPVERPLVMLDGPGAVDVPWASGRLEVCAVDGAADGFDEVIDLDRVAFPLAVRVVTPGERFDPLGMGGRRQRVVEFLRLRRVASALRGAVPVVADTRGIIWVVGHRIADRAATSAGTTRRLGLRWRGHDASSQLEVPSPPGRGRPRSGG